MKKLNAKSIVLIVIICLIIVLLLGLILVNKSNKINENNTTTTTKTTRKIYEEISFNDEVTNIKLTIKESEIINTNLKLVVEKLNNINIIKELIFIYDVKLVDQNNNMIEVKDNEINISIPYQNTINYKGFNVLKLNENNEVVQTIPTVYENNVISFKTSSLDKYAIQGIKEEEITTTTTKKVETTTKIVETTTKKQETTTKKPTTTTTKKVETTTTTTKTTTTKKVCKAVWASEVDQSGRSYLFIKDQNGVNVSATVVVQDKDFGTNDTINVSSSGYLLDKSTTVVISVSC